MNEQIIQNYLSETIDTFRAYKKMAEKALEQVRDDEFFHAPDEESNSTALIVKHIGGNLRSRWTDFLTSDGEKPDRRRDTEFINFATDTRESLMRSWENGWQALFNTLESLQAEDLSKTVQIRGEDFSVVKAIIRSITHTAYHVGQITFLAKHFRSNEWQTLSVPRGQSEEFNAFLAENKNKSNYLEAPHEFAKKSKDK